MLVAPDRKSAVIAEMLGVAVPTVETHIMSARRKLGGVNRFTAARMLSEHEAHQSLISEPLTIAAGDRRPVTPGAHPTTPSGNQPLTLTDVRIPFDHGFDDAATTTRTRHNDLSKLNRIALIAFCVLALAVLGIASIPLSNAVQQIARMVMTQRQ